MGSLVWDQQGVVLTANSGRNDEVADMWFPWNIWNHIVDAAFEFKAWNGVEY